MAKTVYLKTVLTGGGADALDNVDGAGLLDADVAFVLAGGFLYVYILDDDSGASESSPDVIRPDTNADDKRWIMQSALSGALIVGGGGTGTTSLADHGVLVGSGTAAVTVLAVGTNGQVLVGSTGADPVFAAITAGTGIAITPGAGTLTIATDLASPGAIGETAPNTIRGKNKEIFKTSSAASPLTAAECAGTIVSNYGMTDADCVIDLPTAAEGLSFVCVLPAVRARYFRLKCPAAEADKIYLLGVAGADDGYVGVASGYATGSAASFFTFKASDGGYDWFCIPIFGTWVAG
jgi:hypothetical protein